MFDELSGATEQERINYMPTAWNKVENEGDIPTILQMPDRAPAKEEPPAVNEKNPQSNPEKESSGILGEMGGVVEYIRNFVSKNEELIILAIVLLLLADSDDNTELLIAAAVLFLPKLKGAFGGLFKKQV